MVDELSGFMFDMDKYSSSKGGAKARYLTSHNSGNWTIDRKSGGSISIPHACISIVGGIQPGMLSKAYNIKGNTDIDSGFIPRFLFVFANQEKPALWSDCSFSEESKELLSKITNSLYALNVSDDGKSSMVKVSDGARGLYKDWYNKIAEEAHIASNGSWLKKLQAHALRICLLLHVLELSINNHDSAVLESCCNSFVSEDTMRRALILIDWFKSHQKHCWDLFILEGRDELDEIEYGLMQTIADLSVIKGYEWTISNKDLFDNVRLVLDRSNIESNVLGKVASKLGIPSCSVENRRGRRITKDLVVRFIDTVGAVVDVWDPTTVKDPFDS